LQYFQHPQRLQIAKSGIPPNWIRLTNFAPPRIERLIVRLKNKPKSYSRSAVPTLVAVWLFRPVIGISVKLSGKRAESSLHQFTREKIRDDLTLMPM
jgi:hypothetical protein